MNVHIREISFYIIIIGISVALSLTIYRFLDVTSFQAPGSRFTGEDAIWLLKHSNIVIDRDTRIEGIETPFRDYINEGSQE